MGLIHYVSFFSYSTNLTCWNCKCWTISKKIHSCFLLECLLHLLCRRVLIFSLISLILLFFRKKRCKLDFFNFPRTAQILLTIPKGEIAFSITNLTENFRSHVSCCCITYWFHFRHYLVDSCARFKKALSVIGAVAFRLARISGAFFPLFSPLFSA